MNLYHGFKTSEDINEEHNVVLSVDDLAMYIELALTRSKETRDVLNCMEYIPYGSSEDETLDVYPSNSMNSPVVVFIHGGYWKSLSNKDFSYVTKELVQRGFTVVLTNYSLCPKVSIPEITKLNCIAKEWTYNNSHKFNGAYAELELVEGKGKLTQWLS